MNKTRIIFILLMGGVSFSLHAQEELLPTLPKPLDRASTLVENAERNPFAKVEEPKPILLSEPTDSRSEENQIEIALKDLSVSGRTRSANGWRVLLGNMILEEGKNLPPLIADQTVTLRVVTIDSNLIEIVWESKDTGSVPKRTFIPIDLQPKVRPTLGGGVPTEKRSRSSISVTPPEK